jgi:GNAT superfamily N-acetyltransferase
VSRDLHRQIRSNIASWCDRVPVSILLAQFWVIRHCFHRCLEFRSMNEPPSLRRAVAADAAAVCALTLAAYAKWVPVIGREPLPMGADYDRAVVEHVIDLLEQDGSLCALIEMAPADGHLLIVNIAVRPDQQGKGIGARLLDHAERFARSLGLDEIQLYTNVLMASNLDFYGRRGYREFRRGTTAPGLLAVFMRKKLTLQDREAESSLPG